MLSFKGFLDEPLQFISEEAMDMAHLDLGMPKTLHDFFMHLTAPNPHGEGEGPKFSNTIVGKVPLLEWNEKEFLKLIKESSEGGLTHPLLKHSATEPLDSEFHPLKIVRRGIKKENELREQHNSENVEREKRGEAHVPFPSVSKRISDGFKNAFSQIEKQTPSERRKAAQISRKHYKEYLHKEGGLSLKGSRREMTNQNGKTASSMGVGRNTIGLSLAPHSLGTNDPTREVQHAGHHWNVCPHASSECKAGCLGVTAGGNKTYPVQALRSKILKQRYLSEHPEHAARLLHQEIGENEAWVNRHDSLHDKEGRVIGYINKKSGKVKSESYAKVRDAKTGKVTEIGEPHHVVAEKYKNGEYTRHPLESGVRLNVTSDLGYHKFADGALIKSNPNTQFYDYTKNVKVARLEREGKLPKNYFVALSHTGDQHEESNSHHVVEHLQNGGVVASVFTKGKKEKMPTKMKVRGSAPGEHEWDIVNGDDDDNIDQRHETAAQLHEEHARNAKALGQKDLEEKHKQIAKELRERRRGVVSGLQLKGVSNDAAGNFVNHADENGVIWVDKHPFKKTTSQYIKLS